MEVVSEINVGYTGAWPLICADLNGDGLYEYLVGNCEGNFLRAFDIEGNLLWQINVSNYCDGQSMPLDVFDFDCDGCAEVYVPDEMGKRIVRIDGKTGVITARSHELPGSGIDAISAPYGFMQYQGLRPTTWNEQGPALYVSIKGGYLVALDENLKILWVRDGLGVDPEHYVFRGDIDNDGRDEAFVSTQDNEMLYIIDDDESLIKSFHIPTEIGNDTHVDSLVIADINEDGNQEFVTSTGYDMWDNKFNKKWSLANQNGYEKQGQWVQVGKIRNDYPGKQILYVDAEGGIDPSQLKLVSSEGREIWKYNGFKTTVYGAGFIDRKGKGDYEVFACEQGRIDVIKGIDNVYWDKNRHINNPSTQFDIVMLSKNGVENDRFSFLDFGSPGAYEGVYGGVVASCIVKIDNSNAQALAVLTFNGKLLVLK